MQKAGCALLLLSLVALAAARPHRTLAQDASVQSTEDLHKMKKKYLEFPYCIASCAYVEGKYCDLEKSLAVADGQTEAAEGVDHLYKDKDKYKDEYTHPPKDLYTHPPKEYTLPPYDKYTLPPKDDKYTLPPKDEYKDHDKYTLPPKDGYKDHDKDKEYKDKYTLPPIEYPSLTFRPKEIELPYEVKKTLPPIEYPSLTLRPKEVYLPKEDKKTLPPFYIPDIFHKGYDCLPNKKCFYDCVVKKTTTPAPTPAVTTTPRATSTPSPTTASPVTPAPTSSARQTTSPAPTTAAVTTSPRVTTTPSPTTASPVTPAPTSTARQTTRPAPTTAAVTTTPRATSTPSPTTASPVTPAPTTTAKQTTAPSPTSTAAPKTPPPTTTVKATTKPQKMCPNKYKPDWPYVEKDGCFYEKHSYDAFLNGPAMCESGWSGVEAAAAPAAASGETYLQPCCKCKSEGKCNSCPKDQACAKVDVKDGVDGGVCVPESEISASTTPVQIIGLYKPGKGFECGCFDKLW